MIDCDKAAELIPLYVDKELDDTERSQLEEHMLSCGPCKSKYDDICELMAALYNIGDEELPEGFHEEFMNKLAERTKPAYRLWDYRRIAAAAASAAAALIVVSALSVGINGLGGDNGRALYGTAQAGQTGAGIQAPAAARLYEPEPSLADAAPVTGAGGASGAGVAADTGGVVSAAPAALSISADAAEAPANAASRGLSATDPSASSITTYNITLTVDDIAKAMEKISRSSGAQVSMNYGAPVYEGSQGSASITRRVPSGDYADIKNQLRAMGDVSNESESRQNMARQLNDLKAQLTAKDGEKDRLLTLLGKSGDLDTMVKVEIRLNSVSDESDSLNAQIRDINAQIGQPYVNIQLYNRVYAPPAPPEQPLGARIANSFKQSVNLTVRFMQGLLMFVVSSVIPVSICVIIVVLIYKINKRSGKDRKGGRIQ